MWSMELPAMEAGGTAVELSSRLLPLVVVVVQLLSHV